MRYEPGSFLYEHDIKIILFSVLGALVIGLFWFQYEMTNPQGEVQQALSKEQNKLDSIKSDCKSLGSFILDNKGELLDPIVREARDIYLVNCK